MLKRMVKQSALSLSRSAHASRSTGLLCTVLSIQRDGGWHDEVLPLLDAVGQLPGGYLLTCCKAPLDAWAHLCIGLARGIADGLLKLAVLALLQIPVQQQGVWRYGLATHLSDS